MHTKSRCLTYLACVVEDSSIVQVFCIKSRCVTLCVCVCVQVQQHWVTYTEKMDRMVEETLRLNIKWSLLELSKAINGDSKTSPNPLFRVQVVLKQDGPGSTAQVQHHLPTAHHAVYAYLVYLHIHYCL